MDATVAAPEREAAYTVCLRTGKSMNQVNL